MKFHVQVHLKARQKIQRYIESYKHQYTQIYSDTGMGWETEQILLSQYIQFADAFAEAVFDTIEGILSQEEILGYSHDTRTNISLVTHVVERRRLFLFYTEDTTSHTRTLMDIDIVRR